MVNITAIFRYLLIKKFQQTIQKEIKVNNQRQFCILLQKMSQSMTMTYEAEKLRISSSTKQNS